MADDPQVNQILLVILEVLKQQTIFLDRQYGWILAVSETLRADDELGKQLEQSPFYDQGPQPQLRNIRYTLEHIDALIQQLKG